MSDWAEANAGRLCYEMGKRAPCVGRLAASSYRAHPSYVLAHGLPYVPVEDDQRVEGRVAHGAVLSHRVQSAGRPSATTADTTRPLFRTRTPSISRHYIGGGDEEGGKREEMGRWEK